MSPKLPSAAAAVINFRSVEINSSGYWFSCRLHSTGMNPLADTHRMWLVIILWNVLSNLRNLTPSKMIDCQLQLLQVRACAERRVS